MNKKIVNFHIDTQENINFIFENNLSSRSIIIEGKKGLGKKDLITYLSGKLLLNSEKIYKNIHPDFLIIDAGDEKILVDDISVLDDWIYKPPFESINKIVFINNSHNMTEVVQNKILKILEEPPNYLIFFLSVENSNILLPTVISRSLVLSLNKLPNQIVSDTLDIEVNDEDRKLIIDSMDGSLRNIDKFDNIIIPMLCKTCDMLLKKNLRDLGEVSNIVDEIIDKTSISFLCEELSSLLLVKLKKDFINSLDSKRNLSILNDFINDISFLNLNIKKYNLNAKLAIEELILNYYLSNRKTVNQVV
tara:strand:+ start:15607 stop:16521 length:915 start_codon:yes stop_codon:yes gene_type:complete